MTQSMVYRVYVEHSLYVHTNTYMPEAVNGDSACQSDASRLTITGDLMLLEYHNCVVVVRFLVRLVRCSTFSTFLTSLK